MNNHSENQSPSSPVQSFGEILRHAREERGISIEQLSEHTRISRQHIYDLENNDASGISSYGYVIGYLNTIANFLAIDADTVINAFKKASNQETRTSTLEEFVEPQSTGSLPKDYSKVLLVSVLSILVLVIGAVLAYWFLVIQKEQGDDSQSSQEDVTEEMTDPNGENEIRENQEVSQPDPSEEDSEYSVEDALKDFVNNGENSINDETTLPNDSTVLPRPLIDDFSSDNVQVFPFQIPINGEVLDTDTNPEDSHELSVDDQAEEDDELNESVVESEEAEDGEALVFEFAQESWLVVRDGAGNILVNGVQAAGSKLELDGEQPFSIRLGYAHGVRIEFRGEEISLDPYIAEGGDQAQLTLPE